jgi:hypothetical protein
VQSLELKNPSTVTTPLPKKLTSKKQWAFTFGWVQWLAFSILATQEAKIRRIEIQG